VTLEEVKRKAQARARFIETLAEEIFIRDAGSVESTAFSQYPTLAKQAFTAAEAFVKELESRDNGSV
jgi:hypothetical protein